MTVVEVVPLLTKFGLYHSNFKNKATLWLKPKLQVHPQPSPSKLSARLKNCVVERPFSSSAISLVSLVLSTQSISQLAETMLVLK